MNIQFKSIKRISLTNVQVTYTLDNTDFIVEWDNSDGEYDLQPFPKTDDADLGQRLYDAIQEGETDDNKDLELYLSIRDAYNSYDCKFQEFDSIKDFDAKVTETQLHAYYDVENDTIGYSINYAINDEFMIQFDPTEGFTIPDSGAACWNDDKNQDQAGLIFDADELAIKLGLSDNLDDFLSEHPRNFNSEFVYETYCDDETRLKLAQIYN